ncbi:hypothetical protein GJV07_09205 [Enterobacteriaceae bacterium RIT711]|nr:hypothetical protein [Enterobacteriaceae bacterium RIT711]
MQNMYTRQDANAFFLAILPVIMLIAGFILPESAVSGLGIVALVLAWADRRELKKQEQPAPSFWWGIISPVYLWKRDRWQQKPVRLFQLWIIAMVISVAGTLLQLTHDNNSALAESACPIVTQIMKENNRRATCISITNMQETASGRFWKAMALMNTGKEMPVTIEIQGNEQFYVSIPDMDLAF